MIEQMIQDEKEHTDTPPASHTVRTATAPASGHVSGAHKASCAVSAHAQPLASEGCANVRSFKLCLVYFMCTGLFFVVVGYG